MDSKWNVSIVSGANRKGRHSVRVARNIEKQLREREDVGRIHFLDVEQFNFPNYIDGAERSEELNERLHVFSSSLLESDAVILVSPEYNGGKAGSMKNALDYYRRVCAPTVGTGLRERRVNGRYQCHAPDGGFCELCGRLALRKAIARQLGPKCLWCRRSDRR